MTTAIMNKSILADFIKQNKAKLYESARKNTKLNEKGQPTISRDDEWFNENEWDDHFKRMKNKK